jgi:hypothetical protein
MQIQVHKGISNPLPNVKAVAAHSDATAAWGQTGQTEQTIVRNPMSFSRKVLLALALAIVLPLATQACSVDAPPPTVDPITPSSATIDNPTRVYSDGPNSFPNSFGG